MRSPACMNAAKPLAFVFLVGLLGCSSGPVTEEDLEVIDERYFLRGTSKPFTGKLEAFYNRSQKRMLRSFLDGWSHGPEMAWDEQGQLIYQMSWQHGALREWLGVDELFEMSFVHRGGKLFDQRSEGVFTGKITWLLADGSKSEECLFLDGEPDGRWTRWHSNGQQAAMGTFQDGTRLVFNAWDWEGKSTLEEGVGWVSLFYPDGSDREVSSYKVGLLDGQLLRFFKDGQKKTEISYRKGLKHGVEREWHESGQARWKRHWQDGQQHGLDIWWAPDGKVLSSIRFDHGMPGEQK